MRISGIKRDTLILSGISAGLQGLSLLLNVFITRILGETAFGVTSLICAFFSFVLVLAGGNVFTVTGRFISEEIGGGGNVERVMKYCLGYGAGLSVLFAAGIFVFAPFAAKAIGGGVTAFSVRLMALSLPTATVGSCIKGYFYARRQIRVPCIADMAEFFTKAAVIILTAVFFVSAGRMSVFTMIALSLVTGEIVSCVFLVCRYARERCEGCGKAALIRSFRVFPALAFPLMLNAYIFTILSSANEALVPLCLKSFSDSAEAALAEYGIFEGIVMPVLFFPSVILQNLSGILIPEIARENSAKNKRRVRELTEKVFEKGLTVAIFASMLLLTYGGQIGALASENPLAGRTIRILFAVVPFIYLEVLCEGILKGLGKHNFSTLNAAAEYLIRILCVLIFVPSVGFTGVIISYYTSNIFGNCARIYTVKKHTGAKPDFTRGILIPLLSAGTAWQAALLSTRIHPDGIIGATIYIGVAGAVFFAVRAALTLLNERMAADVKK